MDKKKIVVSGIVILPMILVFMLAYSLLVSSSDASYYFSPSGNDSGNCSISDPCRTITKLNTLFLYAGDTVTFLEGLWRIPTDTYVNVASGNSTGNITYICQGCTLSGAYNLSEATWKDEGGNIWSIGDNYSTDGVELNYNTGFEANTTNWESYFNGGDGASGSISRDTSTYHSGVASLKIAVTASGDSGTDIQVYTRHLFNISVIDNAYYKLSFWGKSNQSFSFTQDSGGDSIDGEVRLLQSQSPYNTRYDFASYKTVVFNSTWQEYIFYFKGSQTVNDSALRFYFGLYVPNGTQINLDDVSFQQITDSFVFYEDVGIVVFNGSTYLNPNTGIKEEAPSELDSQGEFALNYSTWMFYLYSADNPNTAYTMIEAGMNTPIFYGPGDEYFVIQDFHMPYCGRHAIDSSNSAHAWTIDNFIEWGGGAYQTRPNASLGGEVRYGNGIQFGLGLDDIHMIGNRVFQYYDACISPQAWNSGGEVIESNVEILDNIGAFCHYPYEFFNSYSTSETINHSTRRNTWIVGGEWSHDQRPDGGVDQIRISRSPNATTNYNYSDNIIYVLSDYALFFGSGTCSNWLGEKVFGNNLYFSAYDSNIKINWCGTEYNSLEDFRAAIGQENGSIETDPIFLDFENGNYTPSANSPACKAGSDGGRVGALDCSPSTCLCSNSSDCMIQDVSCAVDSLHSILGKNIWISNSTVSGLNNIVGWVERHRLNGSVTYS